MKLINLKGASPHTPTPCSEANRALHQDLIARAEKGETTRYSSFAEAGALTGYCPDVDTPSTWMSDEDAYEYAQEYKGHIRLLQLWQKVQLKKARQAAANAVAF